MADELSGKVSLDTTDFKTGISNLNRELRVIESGFRASAASLGDWASSASGLEMRIKALNSEIEVQEKKVSALKSEYERVAAEKGATSRAAQDLEIKLNKETETLGKMESELNKSENALHEMGDESQDAGGKVQDLGKKEEETAEKTNHLANVMNGLGTALKVGMAAIAGVAAAVVGLGGAITKLVLDTGAYSAELVDLSAKTGISTTRLQELAFVGDQVGTSSETVTSSLARMIRNMGNARDQSEDYAKKQAEAAAAGKEFTGELGKQAEAFAKLGVSVTGANGELRDSQDVFNDVINALGSVANETERDAIAMDIFGKSAMELNPLIKAGADEIARLSEEAHNVGAVIDEETVAAMEEFDDAVNGLKAGLHGTLGTLAGAFLPAFSGMADTARTYMGQFSEIVRGADGDLGKMADGVGQLLGQIANDLASKGPEMLQAGLGILQGIIDGIVQNLPQLVQAAVQMITSLVQFLIDNIPMLLQAGLEVVLALVNGILPQLPMLVEMAAQMIVTLITGIADALPQLMEQAAEIIPQVIIALVDALPLLIDAAMKLIIALIDGLSVALPILISYVPQIVQAIFNAIIAALPLIGDAAVKLVLKLIEGIVGMLPQLGTSAVELVDVIVKGITNLASKLWEVGKDIVKGIWDGIQQKAAWFQSQITSFFTNIVNGVKNALGIHSPSIVFAGIGENMAMGLGLGFGKAFDNVERSINRAVGGLTVSASPSLAVSSAGAAGNQGTLNLGGVHIYVNGAADARKVGQAAERGVLRALKAKGMA